jgi:acyl dehydratase
MKKILGLLFLMAVALVTSATEFPLAWSANTINATLLTATTNQTGSAVFVESVKYHTFIIVNATLRTNTVTLSGSLDSTNWVTLNLTTNTAISTNSVVLTNQRWSYLQASVSGLTGTDCNTVIQYLGGN